MLAAGLGGAWWVRENVLWPAPKVAFAGDAGATAWLPYAQRRALVPTVQVRVAGRQVSALVDSGAQYSVIDRRLFADLGLTEAFEMPLIAYGVGGNPQVGRGTTLTAAIDALTIAGLRAAILDLGPLAEAGGLATSLILGQDVLSTLVLDLDVPGREMRFSDPARHQPWPDARAVPVARKGDALATEVSIEGGTATVVVDTGASSLLALSQDTATAVGLRDGRPERQGQSLVLGGVSQAALVTARTVTFADTLFEDVEVAIFGNVAAPGFPAGLLGMEALRGQRVSLDLGAGTMHLARAMDITVGRPARR